MQLEIKNKNMKKLIFNVILFLIFIGIADTTFAENIGGEIQNKNISQTEIATSIQSMSNILTILIGLVCIQTVALVVLLLKFANKK